MYGIFSDCHSLININISSFDTSKLYDTGRMFSNCTSLKSLNLDNFIGRNIARLDYMFADCHN